MEKTNKVQETQGVKKVQKVSASYTLKSQGDNLKKLHELELLTDEEFATMVTIHSNAVNKYIGKQFSI